jgi:hypothetical protein
MLRDDAQIKYVIYMGITVGQHRAERSTQRTIDPSRWNASTGRALGTMEDIRTLNSYLDTVQVPVFEIHRLLMGRGEFPMSGSARLI